MAEGDKKGKSRPLGEGLATEATLQDLLAASGGTPFNFIQKDEGATFVYFGYTNGTDWKFKRKTIATGVWEVATGTGDYDTNWADRAVKTYDYV